jgi:putative transposase
VQLRIKRKRHWLWRAVDKHGVVLDILVQQRRDQLAAETFLRRVLAAAGSEPRVVITDKLASYPPAIRRVLPNTEHRRHKGLKNRAENSHQPTRKHERSMRRFKSPEQPQRFLGPFGAVGDHFRTGSYLTPAIARRQLLAERRRTWRAVVGLRAVA